MEKVECPATRTPTEPALYQPYALPDYIPSRTCERRVSPYDNDLATTAAVVEMTSTHPSPYYAAVNQLKVPVFSRHLATPISPPASPSATAAVTGAKRPWAGQYDHPLDVKVIRDTRLSVDIAKLTNDLRTTRSLMEYVNLANYKRNLVIIRSMLYLMLLIEISKNNFTYL